jgi:hypothetical protein
MGRKRSDYTGAWGAKPGGGTRRHPEVLGSKPMQVMLAALALFVGNVPQVTVTATYLPPVRGTEATVAVQFVPVEPSIRVNEDPGPRLALDPGQQVLGDKPRPAVVKKHAPAGEAHYLDPGVPVAFPVLLKSGVGAGEHPVKGTVTYFYCSKSEGWCRKGQADVTVSVRVP